MAMHKLGWRLSPFLVCVVVAAGCEKVPLLAPSGSSITLTSATNAVPVNGSTDIIAQIIEGGGTPPHSGTHVIFTTTLGRVEPEEAETDRNGRVVVRFVAGNVNGNATITATSGGVTTGSDGAIRISVGTAAVGRITLTANPSVISVNGGTSTIQAGVLDINGNALSGAAVSFSTTAGALSSSVGTTDARGIAQTSLTTSVTATVTATVGVEGTGGTGAPPSGGNGNGGNGGTGNGGATTGQTTATVTVNVNPIPTVSISVMEGTLTAGQPIIFSLNVEPGDDSTAQIKNVTVDYGDGTQVNLGAIRGEVQVQHRYSSDGTFTVRLTVTDSFGGVTTAATVIIVQPEPPLSVFLEATVGGTTGVAPNTRTNVTFIATVSPATATVANYLWRFGDGSSRSTTSNQVVHTYQGEQSVIAEVTVTTTTGAQATGEAAVDVP